MAEDLFPNMADNFEKMTLAQLRKMNRNMRSWPKVEKQFAEAVKKSCELTFMQRDAMISYFIGSIQGELKFYGSINRAAMLKLLSDAIKFSEGIK